VELNDRLLILNHNSHDQIWENVSGERAEVMNEVRVDGGMLLEIGSRGTNSGSVD